MINVAWVARDGYLILFPPLIKKLQESEDNLNHIILCHKKNEREKLISEHGFSNVILLSEEISKIKKTVDSSASKLEQWANKYNDMPLIRCLWSTMFEIDYSEEEIHKEAASQFEFWDHFLIEKKIDILVYERPSLMATSIAWIICQKLKIPSIDFVDLAINTMSITTTWHGDYAIEVEEILKTGKINKESQNYKKAVDYVKIMEVKPQKPKEAQLAIKLTKERTRINLWKARGSYKRHNIRKTNFGCRHRTYLSYIFSALMYTNRSLAHKIINVFDKDIDPHKDRYFLYPLISIGEVSNHSFMGLGYADQLSVIKNIASCLPPWGTLYVKEHATMYADRAFSFYRALKRIPHVKLISPNVDTFGLIRNSEGICTLGGTTGFEAFLAGIPVLLFGEPWYRKFPGVYKVDTAEQLAEYLQHNNKLKCAKEEEKINILYALYEISFDGVKWPQPNTTSAENITNMAEGFRGYVKNRFQNKKTLSTQPPLVECY